MEAILLEYIQQLPVMALLWIMYMSERNRAKIEIIYYRNLAMSLLRLYILKSSTASEAEILLRELEVKIPENE